jgi:hypothetical protein
MLRPKETSMRSIALDARRLKAVLVGTFLVAGLIQLSPAEAADPPLQVLAAGRDTSSQWAAYKIRSNGSQYRVDWTLDVEQDPLQIGLYVYDGDDDFKNGFTWTAFTYQDSMHYEVNVVPGTPIVGEPTIDAEGYHQTINIGGHLFGTPEAPKITKVLIWASGDLSGGSEWQLSAAPGAHLVTDGAGEVVMTSGTNAFVHLSEDFEGVAKAGTQRRTPPSQFGKGVGARAAAVTSKTVEVEHGLIGSFYSPGQGSPVAAAGYAMQVAGPNGYEQNCLTSQCVWFPLKETSALQAGTYRFDLTGGGAGIGTFGDALLWGVDAHLPPGGNPDPTPIVKIPSVQQVPGSVNVSGQASFPSAPLAVNTDPEDDGEAPVGAADVIGAELSGGRVTYDPDAQKLLLQWDLSPHVADVAVGTPPGLLYAKELRVGGTRYEVRILKGAATSSAPKPDDVGTYMALFRCAPECVEQTRLTGWFSWPGRSFVLVEVPLSAISAGAGSQITDLRSFTAIGEASPGALVPIDEMSFAPVVIPESRVELGIAPDSMPEHKVVFDHRASLDGVAFSGSVPTGGLSPGRYRIWMRACLATVCGSAVPTDVTL